MQKFKFNLYVYPFIGNLVHLRKFLTLNKDFSLSKRYNAGWRMSKHFDEITYAFDSCGVHFKMVCKINDSHLYPIRFYVYMYDELTDIDFQEDKVWQFCLYVHDMSSLTIEPLFSVVKDSNDMVECFKKLF